LSLTFWVYLEFCFLVLACQYQPIAWKDLLCVEWDVKPYTMTQSVWCPGVSWCHQADDVLESDCKLSSTYTAYTTWRGSQCRKPCDISWRQCATSDDLTMMS